MKGDLLQATGPYTFSDVALRLPWKCEASWDSA